MLFFIYTFDVQIKYERSVMFVPLHHIIIRKWELSPRLCRPTPKLLCLSHYHMFPTKLEEGKMTVNQIPGTFTPTSAVIQNLGQEAFLFLISGLLLLRANDTHIYTPYGTAPVVPHLDNVSNDSVKIFSLLGLSALRQKSGRITKRPFRKEIKKIK